MKDKEKVSVSVEIFGTKYKLLADSSSASYVTMVGAHVNEQMNTIAKQHPRLDISRLAVLAAINIADDLMKTKEQFDLEQAVSVEKKNRELDSLKEKYAAAVQQLDDVKAEAATAKAEADTAKAEADTAKAELDAANEEMKTAITELNTAKAELDAMKVANEQLQAELDSVREQLREQTEQAEALRNERESLATDRDAEIYEEYDKLKEEYKKLQQEFNEWIELTEEELDQEG